MTFEDFARLAKHDDWRTLAQGLSIHLTLPKLAGWMLCVDVEYDAHRWPKRTIIAYGTGFPYDSAKQVGDIVLTGHSGSYDNVLVIAVMTAEEFTDTVGIWKENGA